MDDSERYEDAQKFISCPYNIAHTFPKFRMARHLVKCRRQHEEEARQLKQCPFNATHQVPWPELQYHETVCPDRESLYAYTCRMEEPKNNIVDQLNENTMIHLEIPSSENWDDEIDTNQDIISACRNTAERRGVLQSNSNEPPAERRNRRMEQRARERMRMNSEEEKTRVSNDSRPDDTGSVGSYRSAVSGSTDVTFNTARNTASHYIGQIQPPNAPDNISRGRGRVIPKQKASEVGFGRGRQM